MTHSMAIDPHRSVCSIMDAYSTLYTAGSVPALVSTAITIIYFTVKLIAYIINGWHQRDQKLERDTAP